MHSHSDLLLFEEALPVDDLNAPSGFKSQCPPDKNVKVKNLFIFKRGRGDLWVSLALCLIALFFFFAFWSQTGWQDRKLPAQLASYTAHQLGLIELDGRVERLGRILKQSWVAPMLCLLLLVPAAIWNLRDSFKVHRWRKRFLLPTSSRFELSKYVAALEYVVYFILYTLSVPVLGYLLSTLILGTFLTWRLGYRAPVWILRGLLCSFVVVLVFRTFLQIKTPVSIWLYDQLPTGIRAVMLTYF